MAGTDIKQLLPKDIYDALTNAATPPTAANPFLTAADGGGGTLAATLTAGDTMLAGQKIRTSNAITANKFAIVSIDGGASPDVLSIYRDNGGSHDNSARIDMLDDYINIIHRGTTTNLFQIDQANGFQFNSGNNKPVIIKMNSGFVMESGASLRYATFAITSLTAPQTYTFQDATGTVAFLSDIPAGGGGLSSVLTAGDTGSAGQNINLVGNAGAGGYIDIANGAGGAGPTCLDASLRIQSINTGASDGETNIETTTCRPSLRHDLNLHATTIGSYVTLQSASTGDGLFKVLGNGEATVQFNLSGTNRTIQFQDASGTVAYLTDVQTGQAWTNATNVVTTRGGYDADATTLDALADNLGTLISDLKAVGILS